MAGIILDLNDDIKRLQQLKAEIDGVKKALTSINVKVDIDIAKGLEARLQKLMGQYDALVGKIAASEAKVKEAESRMNSATQRITEAQERIAQSAGGQGGASAGSATAGVQAQARAYEELERQIDGVLGTRDENVRLMVREQNAIRMINALIKETKKNETGSDGVVSQRGMRLLEKYNNDLLTHKAALSQVRQELLNQAKLNNAAGTSMNALSQSLGRMRVAYRELTEEERKSPFGQELLASIQQADAKIKELDATIGNHQRNVGNYASGWNGLNMSIQQIGRELPSLAMGWNTFFLAISNNLPILSDEISRARKEYEMLKKSGQSATPVWKQVASSLLSWQTALTVGITLLTLYGGEIVEWAKGLFSAGKAVNALTGEVDKFNAAQVESRKSAGAEIGQLRTLRAQAEDVSLAMETRLAAVEKLQQKYPAYLGNLSKEEILAGNASAAYQRLTKDIMAAARARAAQERIDELAGKQIQEQMGANADVSYMRKNKKAYDDARRREERRQHLRELMANEGIVWRSDYADEWSELLKLQGTDKTLIERFNQRKERLSSHNENIAALEKQMQSYTGYINQAADAMARLDGFTSQNDKNVGRDDKAELEEQLETRKKAQEQLNNDLLTLQQKNQDDEIALMRDGTEKKLAEIDNDYKKRVAEIEKQEAEFKEKNKEAGLQGLGADGLTKKQQNALQEAADNAAKERERQTQEVYLAEAQAMRDYLKEYGTFQQQKLAIAEEYAEKIRNAQSEGERLSLEKEREQAVANVNLSAIKQDVDWAGVFSEFGTMFQDEIEHNLDALMDIMKSDEFKAMRPTDQAQIVEAVDSLRAQVTGDLKDVDFKKIGELTVEFQDAQRKMIAAQAAEAAAYDNLKKAQADYEQALRNGTAEEQAAAKQRLDMARTTADSMSAAYKGAVGEFNATGNNLKDATDNAVDAINSISSAISQIKSGSLSGAFEGVKNLSGTLGKSLSNMSGLLGKAGNALSKFSSTLGGATGEIVGAVLGLLDLLKDGFGSIFADLSDLMFGAVNGILDDIFSGDIIMKPLKSVVTGVGSILDTVTFGGFSSWVGNGDSDPTYAEDMARLTESNRDLEAAIDNLAEKMEESSVAEAPGIYEMQRESIERQMANLREQLRRSGDASSNGFLGIGGAHSSNYKINEGMGTGEWQKISSVVGKTIRTAQDFWELTSEEIDTVRTYATAEYSHLKDLADDGHENAAQYMDEYASMWKELQDLEDAFREKMTSVSFDEFYDSYVDMLADLDSTNQDFADNFEEYLKRGILSAIVSNEYSDRLRALYEHYAAMSEDGISKAEAEALRQEQEQLAADMQASRDEVSNTFGWDSGGSSQSGSQGAFEAMSQEQAGELSGRFTAVYEGELRIEQGVVAQTQAITEIRGTIADLSVQSARMYSIADETRSILANSYLELREINENTGAIIKPIKQIQADMAAVKQNTSRI